MKGKTFTKRCLKCNEFGHRKIECTYEKPPEDDSLKATVKRQRAAGWVV